MEFQHLPEEIIFTLLHFLPLHEVRTKVSLINKQFNALYNDDQVWKSLCEYEFYLKGESPLRTSWRLFSELLERSFYWDAKKTALKIKNKGYSVVSLSDHMLVAVANRPLSPSQPYFEIVVDDLPEGDKNEICVGLTRIGTGDTSVYPDWGLLNTGSALDCGQKINSLPSFQVQQGDKIGVYLGYHYMTVTFYLNDQMQGTPFVRLPKHDLYPAASLKGTKTQVSFCLPPKLLAPPMPLS